MNTADTEISRFKIIVIQSLKVNDRKTGHELHESTLKWKDIICTDVVTEFYDVLSKHEFLNVLNVIDENLKEGDILTLQIEAHGCEKGIGFTNGDIMEWNEFQNAIRKINEKIGGLLIVCLAMCFGGATITTINPKQRAPYLAIVAPFKEVPAGAIEDGFREFYAGYNQILDLPNAMMKIQKACVDEDGKPYFYALSSENIFDMTFDLNRDPTNLRKIVELHSFRLTGSISTENMNKTELIIRNEIESIKTKYRDFYLFKDIMDGKS